MKRYVPTIIPTEMGGFNLQMRKDENGGWLRYDDVTKLMRSVINVFSGISNEISDEEIEDYINGRV